MANFLRNESSEDTFTFTATQRTHLSTGNYIDLTATTTVWTFTAQQYSGVEIFALDTANAQKFLNNQSFSGYELNDNNSAGLGFLNLPAGRYYFGSRYTGSLSGSATVKGFVEAATISLPGSVMIGNVPMAVSGEAGAWRSAGFSITGNPSVYLETEGTGGTFMIMRDDQFQAFKAANANGYHGGGYSAIYAMGGTSGGPALEIEGELSLPAGNYDVVWINDTNSWQGGAANVWGYASGTTTSGSLGGTIGGGTGGGTGGAGAGLNLSRGLGNDSVDGGADNDTIDGGGGNDFIRGLEGNDNLRAGDGDDDINGNQGSDTVHGNAGGDTVRGGQGADYVYGDEGDDGHVNGNIGDDSVYGGDGNDKLYGGQGSDSLFGENGNDTLSGDLGADSMTGGPGGDWFAFRVGSGVDVVGDFNSAAGDRVLLAPGTAYTIQNIGGRAVIDLGGGDQLYLTGVAPSQLGDWLVFG